ncbi:hypothetical protein CLV99_0504 [Sphingobacterium yanglingense]|uniref:Uncharacterized protein n=2 Tax=Sphingobacterium yanglingense TaxID=1437280 RepID=A0A4R6WK42_9SPHI|nr:hypothetical protein CLV99_0504 [Sphingobacterium yanglingense]
MISSNKTLFLLWSVMLVFFALLSGCKKNIDNDMEHLDSTEVNKMVMEWGQLNNGRWYPYLLMKATNTNEIKDMNNLYESYVVSLDLAEKQLRKKLIEKLGLAENSKSELDNLYRLHYPAINESLTNISTMDSLWSIINNQPSSTVSSINMSILSKTSNLEFIKRGGLLSLRKNGKIALKSMDPIDVYACEIFSQIYPLYLQAQNAINSAAILPDCLIHHYWSIIDYYQRNAYNSGSSANLGCYVHEFYFTSIKNSLNLCHEEIRKENSPTDPFPPGGTGGGIGGDGGSTGGTQRNGIIDSTLTQTQSEEFLEMLDYAKNSCAYRKLIDFLQHSGEVTIKISPGDTAAFYKPSTKEILYNDENYLRSRELFTHEGFHAYQHQAIYGSSFSNYHSGQAGNINIEFEQIVFQDISKRITIGPDPVGTMFNQREKDGFRAAQDSYTKWIDELTNNGTTYPNLAGNPNFVSEYHQHLEAFKKYGHTTYSKTNIVQSIGPEALKNFFDGDMGPNCSN